MGIDMSNSCFIYVAGAKEPAIVDQDDAALVLGYRYWLDDGGYAQRNSNGDRRRLQHDIMPQYGGEKELIFINGNRLDCRKRNLSFESASVKGSRIKVPSNNTSGFKGVHYNKNTNKWRATIHVMGKTRHIGVYSDKVDAAKAYDAASRKYFGAKSVTNQDMGLYS